MSNMIPFQANQLPAIFQGVALADSALSDNVGAAFAVASIKGKVFRIKHSGNEVPLMVSHNGAQYAAPFFDVIIPKANPALSKTYYKDQYAEGSDASPDCWSEDGIHPLAVPPVSPDCRICPFNQFGSKVTEAGKKAKMCADTRKIAIVPADNIDNERFGGAMLMRIPAASLGTLADYDRMLKSNGIPYYGVVTRITFDNTVAYPKLVFTCVRVLSEQEAQQIVSLRQDLRVDQVINAPQATSPALPSPMQDMSGQQLGQPTSLPGMLAQGQIQDAQQQQFQQPQMAPAPQYAPPSPGFANPMPSQNPIPPQNPMQQGVPQFNPQQVQQQFQQAPPPNAAFNIGTGEIPAAQFNPQQAPQQQQFAPPPQQPQIQTFAPPPPQQQVQTFQQAPAAGQPAPFDPSQLQAQFPSAAPQQAPQGQIAPMAGSGPVAAPLPVATPAFLQNLDQLLNPPA